MAENQNDEVYGVKAIIARRNVEGKKRKYEYLVQWEGYNS